MIVLIEYGSSNYSAHRVSQNDDGRRIGEVLVSGNTVGVRVEGKYVAHNLVQILCLVEECLSVESSYVFIEVDGEEIEASNTSIGSRYIMLDVMMTVICSFGSYRSNLFVASRIAWDE